MRDAARRSKPSWSTSTHTSANKRRSIPKTHIAGSLSWVLATFGGMFDGGRR